MSFFSDRLKSLEAQGLRRELRAPEGIDLSSNDFLDLSTAPEISGALQEALSQGVAHGSGGSRLLSGQHPAWASWEETFASWQGSESALHFSTGFAANLALLSACIGPKDVVISDALNHASLIDGLRLTKAARVVVKHNCVASMEAALEQAQGEQCWVVVESVYSMDGDLAPLREIAALCRRFGANLLVDEAHATGLFGPEGQGRVVEEGLRREVFASVHTCGKALGQSGAVVCAGNSTIEWLINRGRSFVFSTAPAPFLAAGLHASVQWIQQHPHDRARPLALAERFRKGVHGRLNTGFSSSHIVPLIVGSESAALGLSEGLQRGGWHARAIRPPTVPAGECRVRLVFRRGLTEAQVDRLIHDVLEVSQ